MDGGPPVPVVSPKARKGGREKSNFSRPGSVRLPQTYSSGCSRVEGGAGNRRSTAQSRGPQGRLSEALLSL